MPGKWDAILAELARKRDFSSQANGNERLDRQRSAGKLTARERAEALFDGGRFHEIGALAANLSETAGQPAPADGLVAAFGTIAGQPALAMVEDYSVLAGSIGDAGASKRYRMTQLAAQERMPLVVMLEGAGHRLTNTHATPSPNDLQGLADLRDKVPIVTLVFGPSAGHGALAAPLADFTVMTPAASLFAAGPPVVKAAIGESVSKEELGGPDVHVRISGLIHRLEADDGSAITMARQYLGFFGQAEDGERATGSRIDNNPDAILDLVDPNPAVPFDMTELLELVVDEGSLLDLQPAWGRALVVALARMGGRSVMVVANNPAVNAGSIDANSAIKATHFLGVAEAFALPVLFLADTPGVMPGKNAERAGTLRYAAQMFAAQRRLTVPKVHVTLRKAFGFGSSLMAMNPFDRQTRTLAFPAVSLGAMPAAAGARSAGLSEEEQAAALAAQTGAAWALSDKLAFDDIIDPRELRSAILQSLAMARSAR